MNNQIKELVSGIMELAYELNYSKTRQEKTENKPTVFVKFYGHICELEINIHHKGWKEEDKDYTRYSILLCERETKDIVTDLMEIGCELRDLVEEWS